MIYEPHKLLLSSQKINVVVSFFYFFAHYFSFDNNVTLIYFEKRTFKLYFLTVSLSLSSVCGPAELPAAAGHAVVRQLPGLEEATLGRQTGHLLHHRTPVSCLLTGEEGGGRKGRREGGSEGRRRENLKENGKRGNENTGQERL